MAGKGGIIVEIGASVDKLNRGLSRSRNKLLAWGSGLVRSMARVGLGIGRSLVTGLRRGLTVLGGLAAAGIGKSIQEAARFEAYEFQFKALLGSAEDAKKRMEEIRQVDLSVPFDISDIADSSRILTVFTNNAFASTDALKMMADAASVTPNEMKEVAFWYGRAYSMIQSGRPFGEAAMRLQEMGLISGEARNQMERLQKTRGPDKVAKIMEVLNGEFRKFEGASNEMMGTWKGISSVFGSGVRQSFEAVGKEILPLAKVWMQELIDKMEELRENGTLARWGQNASKALEAARAKIEEIVKYFREATANFQNNAQTMGWGEALKVEVEKVTDAIMDGLGSWWEANKEAVGSFGRNLGGAIADGMAKAIDENLKNNKWYEGARNVAENVFGSGDVVAGSNFHLFGGKKTREALERQNRLFEQFREMSGSSQLEKINWNSTTDLRRVRDKFAPDSFLFGQLTILLEQIAENTRQYKKEEVP